MRQKIIGRKQEQRDFGVWRDSGKPEFIAVYGRRRIGKTILVKQFFNNKSLLSRLEIIVVKKARI